MLQLGPPCLDRRLPQLSASPHLTMSLLQTQCRSSVLECATEAYSDTLSGSTLVSPGFPFLMIQNHKQLPGLNRCRDLLQLPVSPLNDLDRLEVKGTHAAYTQRPQVSTVTRFELWPSWEKSALNDPKCILHKPRRSNWSTYGQYWEKCTNWGLGGVCTMHIGDADLGHVKVTTTQVHIYTPRRTFSFILLNDEPLSSYSPSGRKK